MPDKEQIEIPFSKKKMILTMLGAIAFTVVGIWFVILPPKIDNAFYGYPTVIFIVGLASALFFGFISITIIRKFTDDKPGLIINNQGITDNQAGL